MIREKLDRAVMKARGLNISTPIVNSNYDISLDNPYGASDVSNTDANSLLVRSLRNANVRNAVNTLAGDNSFSGSANAVNVRTAQFLIKFLREDDPNKSIDDVVEDSLARGLRLVPKTGVNSPIGDIRIPFTTENGIVKPSVDTTGYRDSISALETFVNGRILPNNLNPRSISIRVSATPEQFAAQYGAISTTERDLSTVQGINFTMRPDGSEVARSTDLRSDLYDKSTVILINHKANESVKGEFGGDNSVSETVLHEYAHTIHRSMGLDWGDAAEPDSNPKTAKYSEVRAQPVSNYGNNNTQEHFAETFAKYLYTGKGSPEFEAFLENEVGLKKFNIDDVYPEFMRGKALRDSYIAAMTNTDLDGFSIKVTSFSNDLDNISPAALTQRAQDAARSGSLPRQVITWSGVVQDSKGRNVGEFQRTFNRDSNGKMWVYHNLFKLADSAQGSGFGSKFINKSFELYKDWGVERVEVTAALSNGPYMWGLMGFDFMSEQDRKGKLRLAKDYRAILAAYSKNKEEYDSLDTLEVAEKLTDPLIGELSDAGRLDVKARIANLIMSARRNGWDINNDLINELSYLLKLPASQATANRIANLGRRNKKTADKNSSSIGRLIMMSGSWRGIKYLV